MNTTTEKRDHEIARDELRALYSQHCPQGEVVSHGQRVDADGWKHNEYTVRIAGERFDWRAGIGIKTKPDPAEVLARYCADALGANQSFADWCSEYGYDADSIKAFKTYMACQEGMKPAMSVLRSRALVHQFADLSCRL